MNEDLNATGLDFTLPVAHRGYRWWYLDALSDDGAHGITIIAFLGTVFSPWYAFARRGGGGDPLNHCCMHVALYGKPARWAMTDRPRGALQRGADFLQIGPSAMRWDGSKLAVDLAEVTAPVPGKLRGRVTLYPEALSHRAFRLDGAGRHHWQPIAPRSRVEVAFDNPALRWSGLSYFDTNCHSVQCIAPRWFSAILGAAREPRGGSRRYAHPRARHDAARALACGAPDTV